MPAATRKTKDSPAKPSPRIIRSFSRNPISSSACSRSALILEYTHESAQALLKAYHLARGERAGSGKRAPRGMSTDEEQDLLRAMLVMAAAGLDSLVKQLVRDALPSLVHLDQRATTGLTRFISNRFDADDPLDRSPKGRNFLAAVLSRKDPASAVTLAYVDYLTSGSLQSVEELARCAAAFGFSDQDLKIDFESLRPIFATRNKIIHELDIKFSADRRNRNLRRQTRMITSTNEVLAVGENLLVAVDKKVRSLGGSPP